MASIGENVAEAIDCFTRGQFDFSVLHACIAVDATAKALSDPGTSVRDRFVGFLRDRYWVIEPTVMPGFDLEQSRFRNVPLDKVPDPDWAEVVYEVFRCAHAHGDEVRDGFRVVPGVGVPTKSLLLADGVLEFPNNLPLGLLFAVVLAPLPSVERRVPDGYHLTLGHLDHNNLVQLPINDWWGCEDEFRPIAAKHNKVRVNFQM